MSRVVRAVFPCVLVAASGACGARSELFAPFEPDSDARVDAMNDTLGNDAGDVFVDTPRDVLQTCSELVMGVPPTLAMTSAMGGFATPRLVARTNGFDLSAPLANASPDGIRGRRITITPDGSAFEFGAVQILGEGAWTWSETGTSGDDLALCYVADVPTLRIWGGAYESRARAGIMFPPGVGTCRGVAWIGDRWISGWHDYDGPSFVVEHARDGTMLSPPREVMPRLGSTTPSLANYGNGAAWVEIDRDAAAYVVGFVRSGEEMIQHVYPVRNAGPDIRLAAWPSDPSAIAVGWRDASAVVHLAAFRDDGSTALDETMLPPTRVRTPRGVEMASFLDGVVFGTFSCLDGENGEIALRRVDRSGAEQGRPLTLPFDCRGTLTLATITTSPREIVLAWLTPRGRPLLDYDIMAASFRCRD